MLKNKRKSSSVVTGSLNYNSRQKESDRIYRENKKLFVKIKDSKAHLKKTN